MNDKSTRAEVIERARLYYARALRDPTQGPSLVPRIRLLLESIDAGVGLLEISKCPIEETEAALQALSIGCSPWDPSAKPNNDLRKR